MISNPLNPLAWAFGAPVPWAWPGAAKLAPDQVSQAINPGWTLAGVVVNAQNSSAPSVEQSVVSRHSYGRQLGRVMDAVGALLDAAPKLAGDERVRDFRELAQQVEEIKRAAAGDRIERLADELALVRASDPEGWQRLQAALGR
ncbi:hypothetical protein HLB44_02710 [Aquincola sp. S2]|uniref:Uncharacterized protein n=1 Tax=Pseudaquabacterium terrae TaxID=2732868 RepID=A0ABX2EC06_9BURK|nr:hypothetical protein [Aquabacterium terrae]NRF65892.1 hypothetical protein [Aquabacterium terrae]